MKKKIDFLLDFYEWAVLRGTYRIQNNKIESDRYIAEYPIKHNSLKKGECYVIYISVRNLYSRPPSDIYVSQKKLTIWDREYFD